MTRKRRYVPPLSFRWAEEEPASELYRESLELWTIAGQRLPQQAKYESVIARLLSSYSEFVFQGHFGSPFNPFADGNLDSPEARLGERWRFFDRFTRQDLAPRSIAADYLEDFPNCQQLVDAIDLQVCLYEEPLPPDAGEWLVNDQLLHLLRLDIVARYLLQRVNVGIVLTKSDDYAFDMFEALNTTGEPLTAFETFRPTVVAQTPSFAVSHEREVLDDISTSFDALLTADVKRRETAETIVSFLLSEKGQKCGRRLNEQRTRLADAFRELSPDDRHKMIEFFGRVVRFRRVVWMAESPSVTSADQSTDDTFKFCVKVLHDARHDITIAPLARFFGSVVVADLPITELEEAAKAVVAFFGLWRGFYGGTNGIDGIHRSWMANAGSRRYQDEGDWITRGTPSVESLKNHFRGELVSNSITRESFIDRAGDIPIYKSSQKVARLLLLAAMSDVVCDANTLGLVTAGQQGVQPQLTFERWIDEQNYSVEHIAPQSATQHWENRSILTNATFTASATWSCFPCI